MRELTFQWIMSCLPQRERRTHFITLFFTRSNMYCLARVSSSKYCQPVTTGTLIYGFLWPMYKLSTRWINSAFSCYIIKLQSQVFTSCY